MTEVEVATICRKYEPFRLRDANREKSLLSSIMHCGIREPLQCVQPGEGDTAGQYILLDGFKRLRCSCKLNIYTVPVISLGIDEVSCILHLIRLSAERNLNTLEQARFVDELHRRHGLALADIADRLECSKAWVSARLGMIDRMSPVVTDAVFSGRFPVRCYMYTLRRFANTVSSRKIDTFVSSTSGKRLSTREIDRLAHLYFQGGKQLKHQIESGNVEWTLRQMDSVEPLDSSDDELSETEWTVIRDLKPADKYLSRILWGFAKEQLTSKAFYAHALLLIEGLLGKIEEFKTQMRRFHDARTLKGNSQGSV